MVIRLIGLIRDLTADPVLNYVRDLIQQTDETSLLLRSPSGRLDTRPERLDASQYRKKEIESLYQGNLIDTVVDSALIPWRQHLRSVDTYLSRDNRCLLTALILIGQGYSMKASLIISVVGIILPGCLLIALALALAGRNNPMEGTTSIIVVMGIIPVPSLPCECETRDITSCDGTYEQCCYCFSGFHIQEFKKIK